MPADKSCVIAITGLLVSPIPIWNAHRLFDSGVGGTEASILAGTSDPIYPPRPCVADNTLPNRIGPATQKSAYATQRVFNSRKAFGLNGLNGAAVP